MNLSRGGLPCTLFFAHAWDDGIYSFARRALSVWPDDADGAYISFLSNPQHFDLDGRLHAEASPYRRVLTSDPPPRAALVLSNAVAPVFSRLWIILEAHVAFSELVNGRIGQVHGPPIDTRPQACVSACVASCPSSIRVWAGIPNPVDGPR